MVTMANDTGATERFLLRTTAQEREYADITADEYGISVNAAYRMLIRRGFHASEELQRKSPRPDDTTGPTDIPTGFSHE